MPAYKSPWFVKNALGNYPYSHRYKNIGEKFLTSKNVEKLNV